MPTDLEPASPTAIKSLPPAEQPPLPCLVCEKPVLKNEWFILVAQATETLKTGSQVSPSTGRHVEQRPVHMKCIRVNPPPAE